MWQNNVPLIISDELEKVNYGPNHPMQPERISMVYDILNKYKILSHFTLYNTYKCTEEDIKVFHTENYVNFMKNYAENPDPLKMNNNYGIGKPDVPGFDGFYNFSRIVAGSSLLAAELICKKKHDFVLNWIGGLHHAKCNEASGFCYVNDCVLAIKRLLYDFKKVLYIDIDIHHGDGVEEAFLDTNRVLTLSFHQFGDDFFPGTGGLDPNKKFQHNLNVPIKKGCKDESYEFYFENIVDNVIDVYRPDAIVMQCGADSLRGDKLGMFNLSLKGHANALEYINKKNLPTLFLGGGGYTKENVARLWALESANMIKYELDENLPEDLIFKNNYTSNKFFYQPKNKYGAKDYNTTQYMYTVLKDVRDQIKYIRNTNTVGFLEKPDLIEDYNFDFFGGDYGNNDNSSFYENEDYNFDFDKGADYLNKGKVINLEF